MRASIGATILSKRLKRASGGSNTGISASAPSHTAYGIVAPWLCALAYATVDSSNTVIVANAFHSGLAGLNTKHVVLVTPANGAIATL